MQPSSALASVYIRNTTSADAIPAGGDTVPLRPDLTLAEETASGTIVSKDDGADHAPIACQGVELGDAAATGGGTDVWMCHVSIPTPIVWFIPCYLFRCSECT